METIIKDYLDILSDIELRPEELNKFIGWLYKHTMYKRYKNKLIKSLDNLERVTLAKENVQELIYYISNTFASENGTFANIKNAKSILFEEGTSKQYTMYSAVLQLGPDYAEIKTYDNSDDLEIIYHTNIIDINSSSSTFTMIDDIVWLDPDNTTLFRYNCIRKVNEELVSITKQYIMYCINN